MGLAGEGEENERGDREEDSVQARQGNPLEAGGEEREANRLRNQLITTTKHSLFMVILRLPFFFFSV